MDCYCMGAVPNLQSSGPKLLRSLLRSEDPGPKASRTKQQPSILRVFKPAQMLLKARTAVSTPGLCPIRQANLQI